MSNDPRAQAHNALKQVDAATRRGDLRAAEHWNTVAAKALATAQSLDAIAPQGDADDIERRRAELRKRFMAFVEADQEIQRWEAEKELYDAELFAALANNTPPPKPLRAHPAGDPTNEENYMRRILTGE